MSYMNKNNFKDSQKQRRSALSVLSITLVFTLALTGCSLLPEEESALKPPLVKPAQENYSTVVAERTTIKKEITGIGYLESVSTSSAQFTSEGGRIEQIFVNQGDQVKKGDLLVQLNMDGLDIQLKEAEIAVLRNKIALKQAKASGDDDQINIAKLQSEIGDLKLERLREIYNSKQLFAEIDGQVIFVEDLDEGDYVGAYQSIVTIADLSKLRVAFRSDSNADIREVNVGFPVQLTYSRTDYEGVVVQTPSSAPETLNQQLAERYSKTLYIDLPVIPPDAKIGSFIDIRVILQQRDDVIVIPRSGLRNYLGRSFVRTLEDGNKVREIDVETGIQGNVSVEITKGIEEGAVIILQ